MKALTLVFAAAAIAFGVYLFWPSATNETLPAGAPAVQSEAVADEAQDLVGRWQSDEDASFIREFRADGTVEDIYTQPDGPVSSSGDWEVFTAGTPPDGTAIPLEQGAVYLRIAMDGEQYYFRIAALSDDALQLIYLDRGGALNFSRPP